MTSLINMCSVNLNDLIAESIASSMHCCTSEAVCLHITLKRIPCTCTYGSIAEHRIHAQLHGSKLLHMVNLADTTTWRTPLLTQLAWIYHDIISPGQIQLISINVAYSPLVLLIQTGISYFSKFLLGDLSVKASSTILLRNEFGSLFFSEFPAP